MRMMQRCGITEVSQSLEENEDIRLVLVKRGGGKRTAGKDSDNGQ